ncbi:MAG: IS110 family transposase [Deltaproteobacteria bacterium]|nr:IS110 family transposase [Deltaproteobacteria bacterium]
METYAGIDIHSSNNYVGIMGNDNNRLFGRRLPNNLDQILTVLEPFKPDLKGVVAESTYNWYVPKSSRIE